MGGKEVKTSSEIRHGKKVVDTIFVHCSATRPSWFEGKPLSVKAAEIKRWHVEERKWSDIGYHWLIDRDGSIAQGRKEHIPGAHAQNHNTGSIGICLIGGHGSNENDMFADNFTPQQDHALRTLINDIKSRTPILKVRGHNEVAAKACPGFSVDRWIKNKQPRKIAESTTMQASAAQVVSGAVGGVTAVSALDGNAQLFALFLCAVVVAAAAWVMRERIKSWVGGHT
jgi:N-acetylmuramoyl-L-alanine amidase